MSCTLSRVYRKGAHRRSGQLLTLFATQGTTPYSGYNAEG